jgi:Carbohydrate family 9 binding domain-like
VINYNAPQATTAPIIDGVIDSIWGTAEWAPINVFWLGSQVPSAQDFTGRYKALWDQGNLYLLVDITDDVLFDATANPLERYWDDDSVEVFIDENRNGGNHQTNTSAWAYHVAINGDVVDSTSSTNAELLNSHITTRRVTNGTQHLWEMSMRVYGENYVNNTTSALTLAAGKVMGFSMAYNDNDASAERESMMGSVDTPGHRNNEGYLNASVFGSLRLVNAAETNNPCSNTLVCLNFETTIPADITLGSNVQIVNTAAKNGTSSLRFYTNNKGAPYHGGYLKVPNVPGKHWGRLYYRIDTILSPANYTHTTFMAAVTPVTEVRLVDTVRDPNGKHQYLYNFPDDTGGASSPYNWTFDNQWVCAEWHLDDGTQTYEFFHNGVRVDSISGNKSGDHGGIPATYTWMGFGGQVYQNGPEISGWIDDIAIGTSRIGCN